MKKIFLSLLALASLGVAGAQTSRNLVVTQTDGTVTRFPAEEIFAVLCEDAPEYDTLNEVLLLGYEEKGDAAEYHLELGTGPADDDRNPAEIGDMQIILNLRAPKSESLLHPQLPAGYYRPGNGASDFTFNVTNSSFWVRLEDGADGVATGVLMDGSVDVRLGDDGVYDLRIEVLTNMGYTDLRYQGKLEFPKGYSDYMPFEEDVDIDFMGGQGRFYGNWAYPFAADLSLSFYQGTIQDNALVDGYWLDIDFCEPKPEDCMDPNQKVADGVYTPENREEIESYTYLPFRFNKGKTIDLFGAEYMVGTRLSYTDATGHRQLAFLTGGSFTVSNNGTHFEFDFTTDEGIHVRGKFDGAPYLQNFCDNDKTEPARPFSTLRNDVVLDWSPGTNAVTYSFGHSIIDEANTITMVIGTPNFDKGDYIQMDFLDTGNNLENGAYTVSNNLASKNILPGTVDFGDSPIFTWYCNMDRFDADGYLTDLSCIVSGTVTVSDADGGSKKIVFDLKDDAGNSVTGEYVGAVIDLNALEAPARLPRKIRR